MLKITCNQKDLVKAIGESQKAVSNKTTMEILKNFYLKAFNGTLEVIGYDLEVAISSLFKTNVVTEGEILINARLFSDIIRKLPQSEIELSVDGDILHIQCANSKFSLKCENAKDFPSLPEIDKNTSIEINQEEFKRMVQETVFATSQDATKPVLMGALIEVKEEELNFVAIDGYRLSISKNHMTTDIQGEYKVIIPGKTLNDVKSLLSSGEETFKFGFNNKYAMFVTDTTKIVGRLIEGDFIDYNRLLPTQHNSLVTLNRSEFLASIERASLLSSEKNNLVKFLIRDNTLSITSNTDIGNAHEEINISLEGDYLDIAFNSRYMCEALKVIDTEEITLEFTSNVNPCIIKPVHARQSAREYTYLILPVRISSHA